MSANITKDLLFDIYGDISFAYGDIAYLSSQTDIFYQNAVQRLISKFNDWKNYPAFGADISSSVGQPVSSVLDNNIQQRIKYVLTSDGFMNAAEVSIISYIQADTIFYRILLLINLGTNSIAFERIIINTIFNNSSGFLYANNNSNIPQV